MSIAGEATLFATWFSQEHPRLLQMAAEHVADAFYAQLASLGLPFSVEVCRTEQPDGPHYDVIFSAEGERARFGEVRQLVAAAPRLAGFSMTALRPARGFNFTLTAASITVKPAEMKFAPLTPPALGIRLFVPLEIITLNSPDLVMRMLETGIGERDAAAIASIELVPIAQAGSDAQDLDGLAAWVLLRLAQN